MFSFLKNLAVGLIDANKPTYHSEWRDAVRRTKKFRLHTPKTANRKPHSVRYLSNDNIVKLAELYQQVIGTRRPEEVAGQCVSVHLETQEAISELLGCEVFFTLGWLFFSGTGTEWFKFDDCFIGNSLQNGLEGEVSLHAWLTLPSMEIIDATLATSIAVVRNQPEGLGGLTCKHADELTGGVRYKPMLVGEDFLMKSGALRDVGIFLM